MTLVFDEIGYWSEIKLDIIKKYALEYSRILSNQKNPELYHVYIDAFAGSGKNISRTTKEAVPGSPQIVLDINPPFKEYYFIDIDGAKTTELNKIVTNHPNHPNAHVLKGDCNERLLKDVFPNVEFDDYKRGFCLLDPYGLDLNWAVIDKAGQMKSIEILLNFPVMDINRNALWSNPEKIKPSLLKRMDSFWGDNSWQNAAYAKQLDFDGKINLRKLRNEDISAAFRKRLKEVAGFAYVSQPLAMRNSNNAVVYYLFHASHKPVAGNIMKYVFDNYRYRNYQRE